MHPNFCQDAPRLILMIPYCINHYPATYASSCRATLCHIPNKTIKEYTELRISYSP